MADQALVDLFRSMSGQMTNLTTTMGAQGVAKIVKCFDGSQPKEFKEWIKSVEKFCTLTSIPQERMKFIVYQASAGPVSDFLKRYLAENADLTWDHIKGALRLRFGEVTDSQHALLMLRKIRQKTGETVQVYAERLLNMAEDAFPGQDQNAIDGQLVGYFIDGLREDMLKLKIMRENSQTFGEAVLVATREQKLRKRFQLRTGHQCDVSEEKEPVPMEIDHFRHKLRCNYCNKKVTW
jgi:hypothetical protein